MMLRLRRLAAAAAVAMEVVAMEVIVPSVPQCPTRLPALLET